jgi:hypothetical protein
MVGAVHFRHFAHLVKAASTRDVLAGGPGLNPGVNRASARGSATR